MNILTGANLFVLLPIAAVSVIVLALIIEKSIYFYKIRIPGTIDYKNIIKKYRKIPHNDFVELLVSEKTPVNILLKKAVSINLNYPPQVFRSQLESLSERLTGRMERYLALLNGLANIATLMGLFGTVSGMIKAFSRMNETGNSDPYILAGGISQALVTTAAGLAVAIPAMLALNFFDSFIDHHNEIMDEAISETAMVFEVLYERKKEKKIPG